MCAYYTASSYDFEASTQTVRFSSRQSIATAYIKIHNDNRVETTEAFQVDISLPYYHYLRRLRLGHPSKAKVFIKDGMQTGIEILLAIKKDTNFIYHLDDRVIVTKPPVSAPSQCKSIY